MDKRIAGVVGAISGLAAVNGAQAAVATPNTVTLPAAGSYAELLDPIPNALALLRTIEAIETSQAALPSEDANVMLARYHHHHHRGRHHHHHHHRGRHHHHHHHRWGHHHHGH